MAASAVNNPYAFRDHWSLQDPKTKTANSKISEAALRALNAENSLFTFTYGLDIRRREIQMLARRIPNVGDAIEVENSDASEEGKSLDEEILGAENALIAARAEDEEAQKELDEAAIALAKVVEEYQDVVSKIRIAPNKAARQKLNKRKQVLDPIKSSSSARHDAAARSAEAAAARLHHARSGLEALNRRKARLAELPERIRERAISHEQKLAGQCARISQLQRQLDADIAKFLDKDFFRNNEGFRLQAIKYLQNR